MRRSDAAKRLQRALMLTIAERWASGKTYIRWESNDDRSQRDTCYYIHQGA